MNFPTPRAPKDLPDDRFNVHRQLPATTMIGKPAALLAGLAAMATILPAMAAAPRGDAKAGERVFAQCRACHKVDVTGTSGMGPNLNRIVGRRAGTLPGFRYSPAMTAANRVWNDATLDAYLASPAAAVPGGRMAFVGLRNPVDRRNVIAYLRSASR